jgi:hypothetical protein
MTVAGKWRRPQMTRQVKSMLETTEKTLQWQRHQIVKFMLGNGSNGKLTDFVTHFQNLGVKSVSARYGRYALKSLVDDKVVSKGSKGEYTLVHKVWFDLPESKLSLSDEVPEAPPLINRKPVKLTLVPNSKPEPDVETKPKAPGKRAYKSHSQDACNCLEAINRELDKLPQTDLVRKLRRKADTVLQRARDLEHREIMSKF